MHNITDKDVAILLVKIYPLLHNGLGHRGVIESVSTVTSSHPIPKVLCQCPLVLQQVLGEGFKGGCIPSPMVVHQGDLHPPLGGDEVVGVIIHGLAADGEVLPARQAELVLIIAHPDLVDPVVEIPVGGVEEDVVLLQLDKELFLQVVLPVDAVFKAPVMGVVLGGAGGSPKGAVRLKHGEPTLRYPSQKYIGDLVFPSVCVHVHVCVCTCMCMCVCTCTCMCVYMYMDVCVCVCVCVCVYVHGNWHDTITTGSHFQYINICHNTFQ